MVEGWHHPTQTAAGALTRFNPSEDANLPGKSEIENSFYLPTQGWAMRGDDVFEDEKRVVVLREVPADVAFKLVFISLLFGGAGRTVHIASRRGLDSLARFRTARQ